MTIILGLDVGPNSIGWALVDEANHQLIDVGVRIFPEGVDNFETSKEVSRNEARRTARGMRRQIRRRAQRKRMLRQSLIDAGLWPADVAEQAKLESLDPYELRARAVDPTAQPLSPHEIGRVFLHINQRRGFLSNRKAEPDSEKKKEQSETLAEIDSLEKELASRTLGQLLHEKLTQLDHAHRTDGDTIRGRHTRRAMLLDEFERIWEVQSKHHPRLLTPTLRYGQMGHQDYPFTPQPRAKGLSALEAFGVHGLIFFQRPLFWPKSMIGLCELELKQPRCPRADRHAQRFRLLQEINNLRYLDPNTHSEPRLTDEQRALLLEKLSTREKMEFNGKTGIKSALGFLESVRFTLERGERPKLQGMVTDYRMAQKIGKEWHDWPEGRKDAVVRVLIDPARDDRKAHDLLVHEFKLSPAQAGAALSADLPSGYRGLSLKAIDKLLPHLERGLVYMDDDESNSALHAAGYDRRDQLQRRVFDKLPDPHRIHDSPVGDLPNPVVKRALVELRKVVNAIIREHGRPDEIHIEMARTVKQGEKLRQSYNEKNRQREALRDAAADRLRESEVKVTRQAINRYLLWEEQEHRCVYSGRPIGLRQLYDGQIDVDHILPYSRCLDDSMMNKVLCFRDDKLGNAQKGQRSPYEWLAGAQPEIYEQVCQRARKLPYPKFRRFFIKELELDKFIARQLVDTSYIARATGEFLRCLFDRQERNVGAVLGVKGDLTAELRHQWGLNNVLNPLGPDIKSRDDHRHHAIDAVIAALTGRSRLLGLTRIRKAGGVLQTGEALPLPWESFRDELAKRINQTRVSYRAERKVAGGLHDDTLYGPTPEPDVFVVRKPLESLSPNEVERIRDANVRKAIERRLAEHGIEVGRGKRVSPAAWKKALCDPQNPVRLPVSKKRLVRDPDALGTPIQRVRVLKQDQTIRPIRDGSAGQAFVRPGSTHHLSLFEWTQEGQTKRDAVFVAMLDAIDSIKKRQRFVKEQIEVLSKHKGKKPRRHDPVYRGLMRKAEELFPTITRVHPNRPEARFLFSLRRGEAVLAQVDGKEELLVYNSAASTSQQMWFYHHADARPKSGKKDKAQQRKIYSFQPNTLNARKVLIDPLGCIRWAND